MPNKLEMQLQFMLKKGCALVYSSYMLMNENKDVIGIIVCPHKVSLASMIRNSSIGCLTAMYDTEKVGKMYSPPIRKRQDWGMWLEILSKCEVAYGLKEPCSIIDDILFFLVMPRFGT